MSAQDWKEIIIVAIGACVTLGVELIRRYRKSES